ncbi:MAG TPA: ribosome maturation factor RimM [Vicinamibacterales bacterium]|nr:ribosome maturation factor RimM [Vicinamibacterales bacterium]
MTDERKWEAMAVVGVIARPHGIRGQFFVNPETDFPEERFAVGATLFVMRDGCIEPFIVSASRMQGVRPVIGFEGIDDIDRAKELTGLELRVPIGALAPLPEGTFYHHDLVGCVVETVEGAAVGTVADVEGGLGNTRLVLQTGNGELLIPLTDAICTTIDPAAKRIVIAPPAGLLELNERRP